MLNMIISLTKFCTSHSIWYGCIFDGISDHFLITKILTAFDVQNEMHWIFSSNIKYDMRKLKKEKKNKNHDQVYENWILNNIQQAKVR